MSSDEQPAVAQNIEETTITSTAASAESAATTEAIVEQERAEKILLAKELYSHGSRNFLVKSFSEAADELSEVCALYGELYGELSDELGMPYLLYAKSLIALALDENKVIDVPDEEEDDDDDDEEGEGEGEKEEEGEGEQAATETTNGGAKKTSAANGKKLEVIKEDVVADEATSAEKETAKQEKNEKVSEAAGSSTADNNKTDDDKEQEKVEKKSTNGKTNGLKQTPQTSTVIDDGEKPSTSNGEAVGEEDDEENEAASNLQLAWEILELAAKIFSRQGERGLANLAEVQTELANIEFENNILEAARDDYDKALTIYKDLPNNYRRAMAEIHYKIGLTFLMQQLNQEGATALKEACNLIAGEIDEIKAKPELSEKDKNNIQDMEETKQEIEAKITEIEETQAQNIAEVRAALDSCIKPLSNGDVDAGTSKSAAASSVFSSTADGPSSSTSSSAAITSSSKPTDISHLIKRKKPEEPTSEAEAACSPAKRVAQ